MQLRSAQLTARGIITLLAPFCKPFLEICEKSFSKEQNPLSQSLAALPAPPRGEPLAGPPQAAAKGRGSLGSPFGGAGALAPERACPCSDTLFLTLLLPCQYQKEGAAHQDCDLPRCPAVDEFCAHAAVPAGGGAAGRGGVPGRAAAVGRGSGGSFLIGPAGPGSAGRCRALI